MINWKNSIRTIQGFPKSGVLFQDITPILQDKRLFTIAVNEMSWRYKIQIDKVVSPEARGFCFGAAVAYAINAGFVPARKKGKLPRPAFVREYRSEYGNESLEVHEDAIGLGENVLIIDDVLATGGTAEALRELVLYSRGNFMGYLFFLEIESMRGRDRLRGHNIESIQKV